SRVGRHAGESEQVGGRGGGGAVAEDRGIDVGVGVAADVVDLVQSRLDPDVHGPRAAGDDGGELRITHDGDRIGRGAAEQDRQVPGRSGEVLAGDGDGAAGGPAARAEAGHARRQVHHLEVAGVQRFQAVGSEDVVEVPPKADVVVGVLRG